MPHLPRVPRRRALSPAVALAGALTLFGALVVAAGPSAATPVTVQVDPSEVSLSGSGYLGHSIFETNDVHVVTDYGSAVAVATGSFPVNQPLAAAGTPTFTLGGSGDTPSMRLTVDFDGDGRPDGTLVGDAAYLPDWWLTPDSQQFVKNRAPSTTDGSGSPWHGTLAAWSTVFGHATVLRAGYSLGPGNPSDWHIASLSYGNTTYAFGDAAPTSKVVHAGDLDAALADDGTSGHIFFDAASLRVYTDDASGAAHVAQYIAVPGGSAPLSAMGQPALSWLGDGAAPRPQLVLDLDGDGQPDVTLTQNPAAVDNWYASASAPVYVHNRAPSCSYAPTCTGTVTPWNGSISSWADAFPGAAVLAAGFLLGPGEKADGDIQDFTAGAVDYTFANTPPTAVPLHLDDAFGTPAHIDLSTGVTDPDPGQTMTYYVSAGHHGTVTLSGTTATYTPADGYAGRDSFLYIADDGVTTAAQALVHVVVAKAGSHVRLSFTPRRPSHTQVPTAHVTVTSAGRVDGGTVTVRVGTFTRTATVSNGTASVALRRFAAGSHIVRARFAGTATAAAARTSSTLHVT